jgi:hypothetical protein
VANFAFDAYKNNMLGAGTRIDLDTDTIKAMFIDHADDTPVVADDFIDDILSASRVPAIASAPALGTKTIGTVAVGVFDAADTVFTALTGDASESLILFKDTGTESTSALVCRWDTATGLPLTPNGADVTVVWAAGGILTIT